MPDVLRPAEPTDSEFLAWAILIAARSHGERGSWDIALPGSEDDRLYLLENLVLADTPSMADYTRFLVLTEDETPIAGLAGYDPGDADLMPLGVALAEAAGLAGLEDGAVVKILERFAVFETCAPETPPGVWVVEWVATRPGHRRRGRASRLLDAILERGRARGLHTAQISFMIGNTAAHEAYTRRGFVFADEKRHPEFEKVFESPGMMRMTRPL